MKRIGVLANIIKPHAPLILARLADLAHQHGLSLIVCDDTDTLLPHAQKVEPADLSSSVDVLFALGGDGTMLRAVRLLSGADTPVLGVNLGSLGFMTSVPEEDLERAVQAVIKGVYTLSVRSLIDCRVMRDDREVERYVALNDIVVGWGSSSRVLNIGLAINGEEVANYVCDGVIVSTPTGSTGHSLSAAGPIVHPYAQVLLVNVICPHTLSARPLILPDSSVLQVTMGEMPSCKRPLLSADGQGEFPLQAGDQLVMGRSSGDAQFVHLPDYSYFSVLRQKLNWRGAARGK